MRKPLWLQVLDEDLISRERNAKGACAIRLRPLAMLKLKAEADEKRFF